MIVDKSNKLERLIKQATFNEPTAAIEDIEYHPDRNLDKKLILELATGNYIQNHHNIILMGGHQETEKHGYLTPLEFMRVGNFIK
ncbi:transposase subunit [Gracilibacillus boraciitolerans JCM 21714]|uniref:Transposase subunit n=1 Tax=Gracilibacillus boraciitolerans JCM 21714 TaxID=1298598 RepID=W4VQ64_9BACI|nr:transposase subunit [Gracilibacillus boraciitolerans JCM 21714]